MEKILPFGKSIFHNLKNYQIFGVFKWFLKNEKLNSIILFSNLIFHFLQFHRFERNLSWICSTSREKTWSPFSKMWFWEKRVYSTTWIFSEKTNTYDQSAKPGLYKTPSSIFTYSFLLSKYPIKKNRFF